MESAERFVFESVREAVSRYARQGAWDLEEDTLDAEGWEGVFAAEGGPPPALRFVARRRAGDSFTSFALVLALDGKEALRRPEVAALCSEHELAVRERKTKKGVSLEATTRIWDGGLNRESFDGMIASFLEVSDAVKVLLRRPSG